MQVSKWTKFYPYKNFNSYFINNVYFIGHLIYA